MEARAAVIIPAAGSGTRMKTDIPKQYLELSGKAVLAHTVTVFTQSPYINQIIIAVPSDRITETETILRKHKLYGANVQIIAGGRRRQDSVRAGLDMVDPDIDIVLVHDGARPFVSVELIERCYLESLKSGAAIAAIPVKDTLKRGDPDLMVTQTIDREELWQAQTPQGARKELLLKAFESYGDSDVTDESSLLEQAGIPVRLVYGEETNIKITRPEDLKIAESIMNKTRTTLRIGHGFDAHRFAEGRKLVLGGVTIEHKQGLAGHSDADVLTHALCDAILGAACNGDIGRHFPDSDSSFKNIASVLLLDTVIAKAASENLIVVNADITIVCQAPKLASHIDRMRENLAQHCRTSIGCINIKATTTEKMGFTGREEGISCHAVVLLERL